MITHSARDGARAGLPSVGVRELKQNASKVVAEVEADHIMRVVTINGRPVAGIVPLEVLDVILVDGPGHRVERVGVSSADFDAAMARFPVPRMTTDEIDEWLHDTDQAAPEEPLIDPWEEAGL
ncbi:hypothetical protein AX769_16355 [Frondihabitans sp. PAMC 28766]|uniref:type II toxin-antitoxin system Phd/YefM family antitoxin n=1 Tax=Frondihabitans sp. PAMC 28766 TaxID=1795630 RepID=UPI00078ED26D|nr:type II toxin-antitoxin system Phd/YefM family antitoxin [Frondihabitans sp. PAMC 28766]AMM21414.1 hypothetical protein AX769_16355 [Frondihabitans sp. PAMC 28766]